MKAGTCMIKKKGMAFSSGKMAAFIKGGGLMGSSTGMAFFLRPARMRKGAYGTMVN
jgi:hypothetical protein